MQPPTEFWSAGPFEVDGKTTRPPMLLHHTKDGSVAEAGRFVKADAPEGDSTAQRWELKEEE